MDVTECWGKYRFLKAIAKQLKNCPFGVNTTTELKTIKTTNNKQKKISQYSQSYSKILQ
jgi:hypothetical protein